MDKDATPITVLAKKRGDEKIMALQEQTRNILHGIRIGFSTINPITKRPVSARSNIHYTVIISSCLCFQVDIFRYQDIKENPHHITKLHNDVIEI
jgi:hypothetical protein